MYWLQKSYSSFLVACLTLLPSFHNDSSYEQKKVHNLPKTVNPISMNKKISNNCYRYYSRRWFHCLLFCSWMFIRSCSSDICDCEKIAGFLEYWHFTKNRIWCRQLRNVTISTRQNKNPRGGLPLGFSCSLGELLLLGCHCLLISVQPFAYVGTNYSGDNRDKKCDDIVSHTTGPPSCWRSGMLYIMIHSLAIFYQELCFPAHF